MTYIKWRKKIPWLLALIWWQLINVLGSWKKVTVVRIITLNSFLIPFLISNYIIAILWVDKNQQVLHSNWQVNSDKFAGKIYRVRIYNRFCIGRKKCRNQRRTGVYTWRKIIEARERANKQLALLTHRGGSKEPVSKHTIVKGGAD